MGDEAESSRLDCEVRAAQGTGHHFQALESSSLQIETKTDFNNKMQAQIASIT